MMNYFKRYSILASLMVLASCSYFDTNDELYVSSKDLNLDDMAAEQVVVKEYPQKWSEVQKITRRKLKGTVEVYDLDMSEEAALREYGPSPSEVSGSKNAGALIMSQGVEIYPIDVSMQKTLKPVQ